MIEKHTREIKGRTYKITQHGAKEGRKILARLLQLLGKPFGALSASEGMEAFAGAIGSFVAGLTPAEVDYFCDVYAPKTLVDMGEATDLPLNTVFDEYFAGAYGDMTLWLVACIEVNYASFFDELRTEIERRMILFAEKMKKAGASGSLTDAIGRSTVSPSPDATTTA